LKRSRRWRHSIAITAASLAATAALAAKPNLTSYFPVHFKDAAWQKAALGKVLEGWSPPAKLPAAGKKTVVQSTSARDGKLIAAIVTMKSGIKEWDDAALAAVRKAAPFAALPKSFPDPQFEVHWHFATGP